MTIITKQGTISVVARYVTLGNVSRTCLAIALRDKLHEKLLSVTPPLIIIYLFIYFLIDLCVQLDRRTRVFFFEIIELSFTTEVVLN